MSENGNMANKRIQRPLPPNPTPMKIINEISKLMCDKIRQEADNTDVLKHSARKLLIELAHHDGLTQLDLVKATHLKAPTVSVTLQKMELDGIVKRTSDEKDLRVTRVFLTDKGREIDRKTIETIKKEEKMVMQGITEEEIAAIMPVLLKMRENLIGEGETDCAKTE